MAKYASIIILLLFLLLIPINSNSKQLYIAVITIDGKDTASEGTNSILKVTDFFDDGSLSEIFPNYIETSSVFAQLDFRGVVAILEYASNSTELIFTIPGRNFEVSFDGGSRDASQEQFKQWLKGNFTSSSASKQSLTKLLQITVADSPVDPVAGNPNSLFTRMIIDDFNQGITGPFISSKTPIPGQQNNFSLGIGAGFFDAGTYEGEAYNIPISYKWNMKSLPKLSLIVDFPVLLTRTQTAWSFMASLGLGAQYRPTKWWSLTPLVGWVHLT